MIFSYVNGGKHNQTAASDVILHELPFLYHLVLTQPRTTSPCSITFDECLDIQTTGITIDSFRESPEGSGVFTFRVTFENDDEQVEVPSTAPPTNSPSKKPTKPPIKSASKPPTEKPSNLPTKLPTDFVAKAPTGLPTHAPTKAPAETPATLPPTEDPTTILPFDESDCGHIVQVNITTDGRPNETTWEIVSATTGRFLTGYRSSDDLTPKRSLESYTEYGWKLCVSKGPETSFLFKIYDTGLDGLLPPGLYSLGLDGTPIDSGGRFLGDVATIEFSTSEPT